MLCSASAVQLLHTVLQLPYPLMSMSNTRCGKSSCKSPLSHMRAPAHVPRITVASYSADGYAFSWATEATDIIHNSCFRISAGVIDVSQQHQQQWKI